MGARLVVGIERAVNPTAARLHAARHLRLGQTVGGHRGLNLTRQHAFDRTGGNFFPDALFAQPAIE